jgi:acyl-coenzyme A synthetase/AMP-(fatty) acid ligase/acyl carrier protein
MHTHRSILADTRNITNGYAAGPRDRWLLATSLSFANSVRTIYGALLNGAALFPIDVRKRGFGEHATWLEDNAITVIRAVPTMFRSFMATLDERRVFPSVRVLAVGGEPMLQADLVHFNRHFSPGCVLLHAFGPTECLSVCWALIPHGTPVGNGKLTMGYTVRDKDVLLLDESRRAVGDGEIGEIAVRSRYLSQGYWRDPERTAASFLPDPTGGDARTYLTGDFGRREPDGRLFHLGRNDFQVKIRGYRIDVSEIENAMRAMAGIRDAVVVGREADPGDQRLFAYYVCAMQPPVAAGELCKALADKLPDYMIPSAFIALETMPRTPNGKTDRLRLPLPEVTRRDPDVPISTPASAVEVELAAIWGGVLGIDRVGTDETFLDLGGDSLQAAMIVAKVAARFALQVPMSVLLDSGTVAAMATVVEATRREVGGQAHQRLSSLTLPAAK